MIRAKALSFRSGTLPGARTGFLPWLGSARSVASRMRQTLRIEAGSSIVEFALASIILFTLIFGVIAICTALYTYNVLAEVTREATRYAIVRGSACHFPKGASCPATAADIQTHVQSNNYPGIDPTSLLVPASNVVWTPNNNPGSTVKVTVTYQFPLNIPFVSSQTLSMSSTSQMLISQ
jgi:Flp pilus assembly protein TadG